MADETKYYFLNIKLAREYAEVAERNNHSAYDYLAVWIKSFFRWLKEEEGRSIKPELYKDLEELLQYAEEKHSRLIKELPTKWENLF